MGKGGTSPNGIVGAVKALSPAVPPNDHSILSPLIATWKGVRGRLLLPLLFWVLSNTHVFDMIVDDDGCLWTPLATCKRLAKYEKRQMGLQLMELDCYSNCVICAMCAGPT